MKITVSILLVLVLSCLAGGCGGPEAIAPMTDEEKAAMTETALAHPDVRKWVETVEVYSAEVRWVVIAWEDSKAVGWYRMDYEDIANGTPPEEIGYVTDDVTINPELYISIGDPAQMYVSAIFDSDRKTLLTVGLQPGRPSAGPGPGG